MADLKIVISALNKASGDLSKVKADVKSVGDAGTQAKGGVEGFSAGLGSILGKAALVAGAVAGVAAALREVYGAAKEGAELEYVRTRFDNLATSIGTVSDALLGDLRDATGGMMSDAELVAGAADFMALGLAKSHDEVVRLTSVAGALGMNMNQLVLTLTNQTTMRFDALGVSVDGFDAKVKALEASGLSANEAFTEAFLQQAEEQILKVGSASDYTIGDVNRLEASVKNLGDSMKQSLLPAAQAVIPVLTDGFDNLNRTQKFDQLSSDIEEFGISIEGLTAPYEVLFGAFTKTDEELIAQMTLVDEWANNTYNDFIMSGTGAEEAKAKVADLFDTFGVGVFDTAAWADANYDGATSSYAVKTATEETTPAIDGIKDATNDATLAMQKYTEALLFKIASEGLSSEAAFSLAEAMGLVDHNTVAATKQTDIYKSMLDAGIITQTQYNRLVTDLADDIENLPEGKTLEIDDNIDDVLADLADLETWKIKPIPVKLNLDTSAVDGYRPPNKYGTVVYQPNQGQNQAVGGAVNAGNPYTWQEYGYRGEVFVPSADGFVLSRADAERALAKALYGGGSAVDPEAIGKAVAQAMSGVTSSKKVGNVYNLTMPTSINPADIRTAFELMEAWA
jgi:hypothetical protein